MARDGNRHEHPTKFFKYFEALKEVYSSTESVCLTYEEAHHLINDKLAPEDRVSLKAATRWRTRGNDRSVESIKAIPPEVAEEYRTYVETRKAKQKLELVRQTLDNDNKAAYKQHWLLERKFQDMRPTPQISLHHDQSIRIEAGSPASKKLIDNIVNGDVEDIDHEEID